MQKQNKWRLLHLFGEDAEGASTIPPAPTPQANEETGDTAKSSDPAAGESERAKRRSEEFRALMEGEYKDLFTAYFQETFNRRFKEQKEMKEQLLHARAVADAAAECFGATGEDLLLALRTEYERRNASADTPREDPAKQEALQAQLRAALEAARTETEARVLSGIRARGIRPVESALSETRGNALRCDAAHLSREQRAEVARRAAKGERIKL
ncbi:MAG: hypothetical protein J6A84_02070 [Clostridia bacterium]|nr:hypothetical protein [Clostridia bacterium]